MPQEKSVEVVRRAFEAWNRGDIDAYLADLCVDVEAVPFGAALEGKVCRGHDEVRAWWVAHHEVWETFLLCAEEFTPVGTELVISGRWEAVGRSGVELSTPASWVFGFRDGKIAYWQAYTSRAGALEAVGLSEQTMPEGNVEIVRAAFSAIRDRDRGAAAVIFTPDAEWHNTSSFPGPRVCVGPDAIIDFWVTLTEDFEEVRDEIEQVLDADGRVVVGFHQWGSGRQSGVPFDLRYAAIIDLVDQRVVRVEIYGGYAKALEAVGVSE